MGDIVLSDQVTYTINSLKVLWSSGQSGAHKRYGYPHLPIMNMGPSQTVRIQHIIYYTTARSYQSHHSWQLTITTTTHLRFGYGELYINTTTSGVFLRGSVLLGKVRHVLI